MRPPSPSPTFGEDRRRGKRGEGAPRGVDELARAILLLLREGRTCEDILRERPDLTRAHIQAAAGEALRLAEAGESRAERVARVRRRHPHAFEPWTDLEDRLLVEGFLEGTPIAALGRTFGRPPGAIRMRLQKLGHEPRRSRVREPEPPPRRSAFEWAGGP